MTMEISTEHARTKRETALQAALAKAGYPGGRDRAYVRVANILRESNLDCITARKKALKIAAVDSDFMIAVFDAFVRIVADDMRGTELPGEGRPYSASNGQRSSAHSRQPDEDARGQETYAVNGQRVSAPPSSPKASGEGQRRFASDGQRPGATSARPDTAARKAARINAVIGNTKAITSLDSFKVRDGRAIGDLSWGELERLETTNQREAWVIRQLRKHAQVSDHSTLVRAVVTAEMLDRMIQKAAELSDAY